MENYLSVNTRKALCVHLGEPAGKELADYMMRLFQRIEQLERNKVSVTSIVPGRSLGQRLPA